MNFTGKVKLLFNWGGEGREVWYLITINVLKIVCDKDVNASVMQWCKLRKSHSETCTINMITVKV